MSVSNLSGHWTDEQLIEHLYDVGPEDSHLNGCRDCQARLSSMQAKRRKLELSPASEDEVSFEFLAAQRRKIYARLTERSPWWSSLQPRKLVSAAAVLVLGAGLFVYEENHRQQMMANKVSDAQLAEQVSSMAEESEAQPTAPLQALFDE